MSMRGTRRTERRPAAWLWRVLRWPLLCVFGLVLWVEQVGWRPLAAACARWLRWPPIAHLERRVQRSGRWAALGLFGVPALLLFPVKLMALWMVHSGHALLGVLVIVVAKLLGTAVLARVYQLTEAQLMSFHWLRSGRDHWRQWHEGLRRLWRHSVLYRPCRRFRWRWRVWWRSVRRGASE